MLAHSQSSTTNNTPAVIEQKPRRGCLRGCLYACFTRGGIALLILAEVISGEGEKGD